MISVLEARCSELEAKLAAVEARIEAVTKEAADAVFDVTERMIGLEDELEAEIRRTDALVEALPKCDTHSDRPATRAFKRCGARFCDDCGVQVMGPVSTHRVDVPTYLHAEPLRAITKARAAPPRIPLSDLKLYAHALVDAAVAFRFGDFFVRLIGGRWGVYDQQTNTNDEGTPDERFTRESAIANARTLDRARKKLGGADEESGIRRGP